MYHAVMEEVVRFLERCHQSLNTIQMNQISRSKSVNHINMQDKNSSILENGRDAIKMRSRTNAKTMEKPHSLMMMSLDENIDVNPSPNDSFATFKDFPW